MRHIVAKTSKVNEAVFIIILTSDVIKLCFHCDLIIGAAAPWAASYI